MKVLFVCHQCLDDAIKEGRPTGPTMSLISPTDSGMLKAVCENFHTSYSVMQQMRFEVLFEIGAHAIFDTYYREAISSFASSLERFLEFYIALMCRKHKVKMEDFAEAWRDVSNQSERQLGAFFFIFLLLEGRPAPYIPKKMIELRNKVVHKGRIASYEDALLFGNSVLQVVNPILAMVKERDGDLIQDMVFDHLFTAKQEYPDACTSTSSMATILSVMKGAVPVNDLREWKPPLYYTNVKI